MRTTGADGPVFLVVGGHPTHRSTAVQEFIAATARRLRVFYLPGYSPRLDPDERVWKNVEADPIGRAGITDQDLTAKALVALRRTATSTGRWCRLPVSRGG